MPAGKLLACEPYGPLGTTGPERAVLFLGLATAERKAEEASVDPDQIFDL